VGTEEDVGKGAGIAVGVATAACAEFGPGAALCGVGAAIVSAFVALGTALSKAGRDTFHPDAATAAAALTLARIDPMTLMQGEDNTGEPYQASHLVRYWRVLDQEVPTGKFGSNGVLSNPSDASGGGNPYLARSPDDPNVDPEEPLAHLANLQKVLANYQAWVAAGSDLRTFAKMNPPVGTHGRPQDSKALLQTIRMHPGPFHDLAGWDFFQKYRGEIAEAVRAARARAGESGRDRVLESIFGDVTPATHADPKMRGAPGGAPAPWTTGEKVAAGVAGAGALALLALSVFQRTRQKKR
jgi:hypothetical protein